MDALFVPVSRWFYTFNGKWIPVADCLLFLAMEIVFDAIFSKKKTFWLPVWFLHNKRLLKRIHLKRERMCFPWEQILSFKSRRLFRRKAKTILPGLPLLELYQFPLINKIHVHPAGECKPKCAAPSGNVSSSMRIVHKFRFIPRMRNVSSGHLFFIGAFYSIQRLCYWTAKPWSVCADAQADLGLRCPYMPKDTFMHEAAQIISNAFLFVCFLFYFSKNKTR